MKKKLSQLERDTAAWYENLSEEELRDERELEKAICSVPAPNVDAPEE
jgi:hypothetical protein